MTETLLLRDLAIVMAVAAFTTWLAQHRRQPAVIGYLIAGLLIGPHTPPFSFIKDSHSIHTMAELGLVFLMFSLGLEFNLARLRRVGVPAAIAALLEVLGMGGLGYLLGRAFGWTPIDSVFLGAILSISSTTIIVKVLSDLKMLKEGFASLVFGILILEDVVAVVVLTVLAGFAARGSVQGAAVLDVLGDVGFFVVIFLVIGLAVIPRAMRQIAKTGSRETLGIMALGLCLAASLLAREYGFSVALGAFLMGSVLGLSDQVDEIEEWIHPVRDMFSAIFFVAAGMLIDPATLWAYKWQILVISLVTVVGKTVSGTVGSLIAGFRTDTSVRVGLTLAQIGEFSFVFAGLGMSTRLAGDFLYPLAVAVSAITTLCTPYLIRHSDRITAGVLRLAGEGATARLESYQDAFRRHAGGGLQSKIFSRYLLRLGIYVSFYFAAVLVTTAAGRLFVFAPDWAAPFQAVLWAGAGAAAAPITMGVARYFSHFLLLVLTEGMVHLKLGALFRRIPIHRAYELMEKGVMVVLLVLFITQGISGLPGRGWALFLLAFVGASLYLARERVNRGYRGLEGLLDDAIGLASSEPLRRAALSVEGGLTDSVERVFLRPGSPAAQQTILGLGLREKTGASLIAVYRQGRLETNPSPAKELLPNDILVLLGDEEQRQKARRLLE